MKKDINIENSLIETLSGNSLEMIGEITELTIDQFIDNDFLKEIPFFSVFYKSFKTVQGIRESLFAMKVYKFLKEFEQIKKTDKDLFIDKISEDKKERIKVGQTLIMILDKIDELDKTQIIANIFVGYLKSELTKSELTQFCSIIEKAFIDDIISFSKMTGYNDLPKDVQVNLSALGLMAPIIQEANSIYGVSSILEIDNKYTIHYVNSKIGMKIRKYIKPSS
nr:hypothetical protein [uncultured Draconibacterium sp.]